MSDETPARPSKPFMNHQIFLEDNWEFNVTGPEFDDSKYAIRFPSYKAAHDEIQKRVEETRKAESRKIKLDLTVLKEDGTPLHVTGINRSTGLISGAEDRVYPNIPWVKKALARHKELHDEERLIWDSLRSVEIRAQRNVYGRITAEDYAARIKSLQTEVEEKTLVARERAGPTSAPTTEETTNEA